MKIKKAFIKFWVFISTQGADDKSGQQGKMITLLNQAAFLTAIGTLFMAGFCLVTQPNVFYLTITSLMVVQYSLIIIIHRYRKPFLAQKYIVFITSLWIPFVVVLTGTFFSQSIAVMTTIMLGYFFFHNNKKLQIAAFIYNSILYLSATTYIAFYPPLITVEDLPFDEACVFILSMTWIYVIYNVRETERQNLISDLVLKNKELEERTEELKRFSYIASHDLKSPLRTIISFLGLMERDLKKGSVDNLAHNLEFARSGAQQLNYLVKDVLELSKINTNKPKVKKKINLNSTLKKVMLNLNSEIKEKNVVVNAGELPTLICNEVEFTLLFQNIIQNGIKYNEARQPVVNIWSEEKDDIIQIHFEDNGIGIESNYFQQIFVQFKRLHTDEKYKGTGLGLALCKKIAKSYGGEIEVQSVIGKGSNFTVTIPVLVE